jgi:hypothetical protein
MNMSLGPIMFPQRELHLALVVALLVTPVGAFAKHGYNEDPRLTPLMNAARHNDMARLA